MGTSVKPFSFVRHFPLFSLVNKMNLSVECFVWTQDSNCSCPMANTAVLPIEP